MDDPLPDFEGDVDLGAAGLPPFFGDGWETVEPGTEAWNEAEKIAAQPAAVDDSFPADIEQELRGLMFLGQLERRFELLGHSFVMRTLKSGEELACTLVIKEFEGSLGQAKALAQAFVGASIVTVDGKYMVRAIGPDQTQDIIRQRFEYVGENWYWPVIEMLYTEYSDLVLRQAQVYEALAGKSPASRVTS